jgi:hypothetical protein
LLKFRPIQPEERCFRHDRLEVVDYDAPTGRYYSALDLNNAEIAMTQGLEPLEHDPQFHQQMVYALASKARRCVSRRRRHAGPRQPYQRPCFESDNDAVTTPALQSPIQVVPQEGRHRDHMVLRGIFARADVFRHDENDLLLLDLAQINRLDGRIERTRNSTKPRDPFEVI